MLFVQLMNVLNKSNRIVQKPLAMLLFTFVASSFVMPSLSFANECPVPDVNPRDGVHVADESLPMSGLFYGMTHGGLQTGNSFIAIEHSVRFRAEKTGSIQAVRWENRLLTQDNINNRTGDVYATCIANNLEPGVCGYMMGSSYHVGNGGKIVATIHPDNGSGRPNESVELGRVSSIYIPTNHPHGVWVTQNMQAPVPVTAGNLYHLKLQNLAPPTLPLHRNTVAQARARDRNTGAISLNGVWHGEHVGPDSLKWGPYYGRMGQETLYRNAVSGSWNEGHETFAWMEFLYTDGVWAGESFTGYDNIATPTPYSTSHNDGFKIVEGNVRARQVFTVRDQNRIVNGMWLNFGHQKDASLTPLTVELKNASNTVLASGSIAASNAVRARAIEGASSGNLSALNAKTWGYTDLAEVELQVGQTYYLELSAASGAGYHVNSFFRMTTSNRNEWRDAYAQANKGSGWETYSPANGRTDRDLPLMFTVRNGPKQLP